MCVFLCVLIHSVMFDSLNVNKGIFDNKDIFVNKDMFDSFTIWTVAHQTPLSTGFSRKEYWSGLWCPPPGGLPNPGMEPRSLVSPALASRTCTFPLVPPGKPKHIFRDRQNQANLEHPATPTDRHTQSTAEQPSREDWESPTVKSGRFDAFSLTREHRAQPGRECDIKGSILKS